MSAFRDGAFAVQVPDWGAEGTQDFGTSESTGRIYHFREVRQRRFVQANDPWGRIVPMDVLAREVGVKRGVPGQASLWEGSGR